MASSLKVEQDCNVLYWNNIPFGRADDNDGTAPLAGYVNVRIQHLEQQVEELKGIVNDLLTCIRDTPK